MKNRATPFLIAAALLAASTPAYAVTASFYINEISSDEQNAYDMGTLETAALISRRAGNVQRADCILEWGLASGVSKEILVAMENNPKAPAAAVILALIERRCGK